MDNKTNKKSNLVGYPFLIYTGETSFTLGAFALYTSRPENQSKNIPPTSVVANALLSIKKNALVMLIPEFVFDKGNLRYSPSLKYQNWPSEFYGLSQNSLLNDKTDYLMESFEFKNDFKFSFAKNLFIKSFYRFQKNSLSKIEEGSVFSQHPYLGKNGGFVSGIGFGLEYDSRDNNLYPTSGLNVFYDYYSYNRLLKSNYSYNTHQFNIKFFVPYNKYTIFALNSVYKANSHSAPFYEKTQLGYDSRAYSDFRFIDDQLISLKSEIRTFPWNTGWKKRLGLVAFFETTQVKKNIDDFVFHDFKPAIGFGLRYSIVPQEKLNLRLDFGVGKDSKEVIFIAREAF